MPGLHNLAVEEQAMAGWEIASARSALGAGSLGSLVPARRYPNGSGGGGVGRAVQRLQRRRAASWGGAAEGWQRALHRSRGRAPSLLCRTAACADRFPLASVRRRGVMALRMPRVLCYQPMLSPLPPPKQATKHQHQHRQRQHQPSTSIAQPPSSCRSFHSPAPLSIVP